ncbi:Calcium/calmodulin-dependent/calcium-dependent protein kinase [Parasponia andersonii]|uniref:non-specific serine/threonine protein kinase n=1 Tax=Parasponia andersonii TaxID=3476 RepID=A0A2P5A783_PARAD|nr:Calcium/calmodulin-dependent/calcium-dependent protein kinase [Parasponia andersonii]
MPEIGTNSGSRAPPTAGQSSPEINLFGKYELGKLLGVGAFAKVYHARNVRTGQSVAVKAVSKAKVLKGGFTAQVKREISIMRRLHHPNIVKLLEVMATKTKIYFVMEFAKGGELFTKVAKGRFSEDLSRRYFHQLISAVGYCHSRGVSDFGLSAVSDQIRPDGLLHTLCGTPAYVAPEILAKKGYDGAKVDVWTCGVILFVLTSGYLPFNDANLMVMYRKIYKGEFRFPKWTSPDLKRLISRLLDTNPEARITVDQIINDPWFKRGYRERKFHLEDLGSKDFGTGENNNNNTTTSFNAFNIISFSSGVNLSGLFSEYSDISECEDRFVSAEAAERVVDRVEEVAKEESLTVTRNNEDWWVKLEGHDGNFVALAEVHRLTKELVLVEVKLREREVGPGLHIWKDKLRPKLEDLVCQPEASVSGS